MTSPAAQGAAHGVQPAGSSPAQHTGQQCVWGKGVRHTCALVHTFERSSSVMSKLVSITRAFGFFLLGVGVAATAAAAWSPSSRSSTSCGTSRFLGFRTGVPWLLAATAAAMLLPRLFMHTGSDNGVKYREMATRWPMRRREITFVQTIIHSGEASRGRDHIPQ